MSKKTGKESQKSIEVSGMESQMCVLNVGYEVSDDSSDDGVTEFVTSLQRRNEDTDSDNNEDTNFVPRANIVQSSPVASSQKRQSSPVTSVQSSPIASS
eukprot:10616433-Ditylum_brightwellii.AAC.1